MQMLGMHEYYERIIASRRSGVPTISEARADYLRLIVVSVARAV